jgi:hypothetical protein
MIANYFANVVCLQMSVEGFEDARQLRNARAEKGVGAGRHRLSRALEPDPALHQRDDAAKDLRIGL